MVAYRPREKINEERGEVYEATESLQAVILSRAHNFPSDLPRGEVEWESFTPAGGYTGWFYFVQFSEPQKIGDSVHETDVFAQWQVAEVLESPDFEF